MTPSQENSPFPGVEATASRCDHKGDDTGEHDIEKSEYDGAASTLNDADETNDERYIVSWEEPEDKDKSNPMSWPSSKKWRFIALLSFTTFVTPLASSMFAPGVPVIMVDFNNSSNTFATFVVSIFVLGFAAGPFIHAPLSELYGRVPVYHVCNAGFLCFTIMCAISKDSGMLLASRFWAGFTGVATVTCGSSTIADMVAKEKRAAAMSFWAMGPLLGPVIGPVVGGVLVEKANWRWTFWTITIMAGLILVAGIFVFEETYPPAILEKKAARLRKETKNEKYRSKLATNTTGKEVFRQSFFRPVKLLLFSPAVFFISTYIAVVYGILYILFTTFSFVFKEVYGFSEIALGLTFLGCGVGNFLGLAYAGRLSDREIRRKVSLKQEPVPEDRLPYIITLPACLSLPAGMFLYGWAVQAKLHWIVPMIGTSVTGFGMICIFMATQVYLVDAHPRHAASASAANTVLRSVAGALLPLCGLDVYDALGFGWGNSLFGFVLLAMAPLPVVFKLYGHRFRRVDI